MNLKIWWVLVVLGLGSCQMEGNKMGVEDLTVEYLQNPIGIDKASPVLGWQLMSEENGKRQSAYQILVASDPGKLNQNEADLWNTGKVKSARSVNLRYGGKPLTSGDMCYWKVRAWDQEGNAGAWSGVASWMMGLLNNDAWNASWISHQYAEVSDRREPFSRYDDNRGFDASDSSAVYMRKTFETNAAIRRVTAFISGLGYYELYLNGQKIGNRIMDPVFTDYQKQVKYAAYDVTENIGNGTNVIGVILGNGFYNLVERDLFQIEKANWKTPKKMICNILIEYEDGKITEITSDETWKWSTGPLIYNSIRGGESIDARLNMPDWNTTAFDDSQWQPAVPVPAPLGRLTYQYMPPMRETKSFQPVSWWQPKTGVYVFDFGENMTGYADITIGGKEGQVVTIDFNEVLNGDSTLNVKHSAGHTWGRFQQGRLILSGKGKDKFQPRFTYHGFRYVQLSGMDDPPAMSDITALSVHTDLQEAGTFECSNPRLNQLHAAVKRTLLNSVHSMPGEEPTREKMGWTLDAGIVTMESYLMNFNAINTYRKYLQDLIDAQEPNGHVPPIVPTNGWGFLEHLPNGDSTIRFDDPWWGGTIVYVANKLFEFTGDTTVLHEAFTPMRKYVDFVMSTASNDLVYWSLGDWLDLKHGTNGWGPGLTPIVQTSTACLYYMSDQLAANASLLGKDDMVRQYRQQANRIKEVYNRQFLDRKTGWYHPNSQTAQVLPLALGLVPEDMVEKVEERLLQAIADNNFHTSVGFIGVNPLLKYLSDRGHLPTIYRMVTQEESPGWLHFVKNDKSTMGENLNAKGYGTGHHPFTTNIGFWLFYYLGGIQPDPSGPGFSSVILKPGIQTELEWANTSYHSLKGKIVSNWKKNGGTIAYHVELPTNTSALLKLPAGVSHITVNGTSVESHPFVTALPANGTDEKLLEIQSGKYDFEIKWQIGETRS